MMPLSTSHQHACQKKWNRQHLRSKDYEQRMWQPSHTCRIGIYKYIRQVPQNPIIQNYKCIKCNWHQYFKQIFKIFLKFLNPGIPKYFYHAGKWYKVSERRKRREGETIPSFLFSYFSIPSIYRISFLQIIIHGTALCRHHPQHGLRPPRKSCHWT